MMDLQNVIDQMQDAGLPGLDASDLIIDGNLHRFKPAWEPIASKKRAWFVLFSFQTNKSGQLIFGRFGWFKGSECFSYKIESSNGKKLDRLEFERYREIQRNQTKKVEVFREKQMQDAASRAKAIWENLPASGRSEYLFRKRVKSYGLKFSRGAVIAPVMDLSGKIHGLQFIYSDGTKKFLTGTMKKSHFYLLGEIQTSDKLCIAEGYSTSASIFEATRLPVAVAFDAGNLKPVAEAFRNKFPDLKIVICGDDDTEKPTNTGRQEAVKAAQAIQGIAVFPTDFKETI